MISPIKSINLERKSSNWDKVRKFSEDICEISFVMGEEENENNKISRKTS